MAMAIFIYRPESGYTAMNIILMTLAYTLAYGFFWAGKKFITVPRMGQVRFGPARKRRWVILVAILGGVILIQAGVVGLTSLGRFNLALGVKVFPRSPITAWGS